MSKLTYHNFCINKKQVCTYVGAICMGSMTLRHSSANSTNRGSCIASCMAYSGLGELSTENRSSWRCGFCKIYCKTSLFANNFNLSIGIVSSVGYPYSCESFLLTSFFVLSGIDKDSHLIPRCPFQQSN